jgi:hypothetical protein
MIDMACNYWNIEGLEELELYVEELEEDKE